jgi:hypothetical protein
LLQLVLNKKVFFFADGLSCASQLDQHALRLIVSDYAILRVASPPPTLPVVDLRPVREYGTAIGTWLILNYPDERR